LLGCFQQLSNGVCSTQALTGRQSWSSLNLRAISIFGISVDVALPLLKGSQRVSGTPSQSQPNTVEDASGCSGRWVLVDSSERESLRQIAKLIRRGTQTIFRQSQSLARCDAQGR
jgi:hypothetical protein